MGGYDKGNTRGVGTKIGLEELRKYLNNLKPNTIALVEASFPTHSLNAYITTYKKENITLNFV